METTPKRKSVPANLLNRYFLHNIRSHNIENDITITFFEIGKDHFAIERKKELLCNRKLFWQRMPIIIIVNNTLLGKKSQLYYVTLLTN